MSLDFDELYSSFVQTSKDILSHAEELILKLEESFEKDVIEDLFRGIHTIKGNCGIFELPVVDKVAHVFEDYLSDLRDGNIQFDNDMVDPMLLATDVLHRLIIEQEEFTDDKIKETMSPFQLKDETPTLKNEQQSDEPVTNNQSMLSNELEKKETVNNQKYKIPKKDVDLAKKNKLFLYFLIIDIEQQKFNTFLDFNRSLNNFLATLSNTSQALVYLKNKTLSETTSTLAILGTSAKQINENNEFNIIFKVFKEVYSPQTQKSTEVVKTKTELQEPAESKNIIHEKVSVKVETLDKLVQIMRETVLTRNQLLRKSTLLEDNTIEGDIKKIGSQISELQEIILETRLQDISIIFARIPRLLRDTAHKLGKKVNLKINATEVELDKSILDKITDPIVHIVRNAIDHGIESPQDRLAVGKPEEGTFLITASLSDGNIEISFKDDGGGLNFERIREKIIERKILDGKIAVDLSKEQLLDYIFKAGFSTAKEVTSVSGRGVGLDAVRTELEAIGGTIRVESEVGIGTEFILKIPQSISIMSCYIAVIGNKNIAIQEKLIVETITNNRDNISIAEGKPVYKFRGSLLPLIDFLHVASAQTTIVKIEQLLEFKYICIVQTEYHTYGILTDEFKEQEELVIKPTNPSYLKGVEYLAGSGVLGDGSVALFLDLNRLAQRAKLGKNDSNLKIEDTDSFSETDLINYVIFEYSYEYFAFSFAEVSRIIEIDDDKVGQVMGKAAIKENDTMVPLIDLCYTLKVESNSENRKSIILLKNPSGIPKGVPVDSIVNFSSDITSLQKGDNSSPLVRGQGFYQGKPIVILDSNKIGN